MASSESYSDFEQNYNDHLSRVRSFLAAPTIDAAVSPSDHAANINLAEQALKDARMCVSAMRGLAEIEGDPFKAEEAKRKLEREIGPLEKEVQGRRRVVSGGGGGGGGGLSSVFGRSIGGNNNAVRNDSGGGGRQPTSDERYLFGNQTNSSYNPPSVNTSLSALSDDDLEGGEGSLTTPLTAMEQRTQDSQRLLRETQALCAESEQIGASTLEQMGMQREQMERSRGLIEGAMEDTAQARQIMKEMARRALRNKVFLYCIIALLVLANGSVIVHLWRRKK